MALAGAALALAGCAQIAPLAAPAPGTDRYTGRLAMRVEADGDLRPSRAFSAAFDLRGGAESGAMSLSTPLGSTIAEARWDGRRVHLKTPSETRSYADLASMTREVLGESVPVEAWFDWLRGRPWPGAPSTRDARGFEQLGWRVEGDGAGSVRATRATPPPLVTVRIRLDDS